MKPFGFNNRYKLLKTDDFSSVFSFRKRFSGAILIIHHMPNTAGRPRLGLVVAKKITRSAVQRNYMKRVLRELFRQNRARLGNLDLVIRPQKTFGPALYQQVRTEFEQALVRLAGRGQAGAA